MSQSPPEPSPSAPSSAATPIRAEARVLRNHDDGGGNRRILLGVPDWPGSAPGQFLMLSPGAQGSVPRTDPLLPRPMAVYRQTPRGGETEIEVLYKVTGRGTSLLADAREDQRVRVVGPLGRGFPAAAEGARIWLVGGGTGIASLFETARHAASRAKVGVILGGRSAVDLMGRDDFAELPIDLRLTTEDGSVGKRGRVTELLEEVLAAGPADAVYSCGPTPMMRRCDEIARAAGLTSYVSLENNMACGFGVCLGCAAPRSGEDRGFALVCREGPVFDGADIDWDGLP